MINISCQLVAVALQIMINAAPRRRLQQLGVMAVVTQVPYWQLRVRVHRKPWYHQHPCHERHLNTPYGESPMGVGSEITRSGCVACAAEATPWR
jgi:hypothetical protein